MKSLLTSRVAFVLAEFDWRDFLGPLFPCVWSLAVKDVGQDSAVLVWVEPVQVAALRAELSQVATAKRV